MSSSCRRLAWTATLTLLACGGGGQEGTGAGKPAPEAAVVVGQLREGAVRDHLQELSRLRVLFGHQSVGQNIMVGVERVAREAGQPLHVVPVQGRVAIAPGTLAHVRVADNGLPLRKLESFERALSEQPAVDVALVKFCYVDVVYGTDVAELFAAYQGSLARFEAKYPHTTFVRATVPLRTAQRGRRTLLKQLVALIREETPVTGDNARREEFNELVRKATSGRAALFDLARIESTHPDGRLETASWDGKSVAALVPAYTDDGGHLNEIGQERAARELLSVLADAAAHRFNVRP